MDSGALLENVSETFTPSAATPPSSRPKTDKTDNTTNSVSTPPNTSCLVPTTNSSTAAATPLSTAINGAVFPAPSFYLSASPSSSKLPNAFGILARSLLLLLPSTSSTSASWMILARLRSPCAAAPTLPLLPHNAAHGAHDGTLLLN